jgi:ATP-dependent exoDNAse (exonuclease V) beta subunit
MTDVRLSNQVVLASAGSGKTHVLTTRLLALLAAGMPPRSILATTFTRKAAGEILQRALERLVLAARNNGQRSELARQIDAEAPGVGSHLTRQACEALAARIAREVHRLGVGTLDAFMMKLAAALGPEAGLPSEWAITDEATARRIDDEALRLALDDTDAAQVAALVDLLRGARRGGAVGGTLRRAVEGALEAHSRAAPDAWEAIGPEGEPLDPAAIHEAVAHLRSAPAPLNSRGDENGHWRNAMNRLLEHVRAGNWEAVLANGLAWAVTRHTTYHGIEPEEPSAGAIRRVVEHARAVYLARLRERNLQVRDLLARFDHCRRRVKRRCGLYRFDDVASFLAGAHLDDLYYRLDGRLDHVLLDEFQDTSIDQFRVLEPVLDEIIAAGGAGRSVLCVGDVKQSLYGWRDAEPELLPAILRRWPGGVERRTLARNWRSSPVILDVVNRVFSGLERNAALLRKEPAARAGRRFAENFEPHQAARDLPGLVRVVAAPGDASDDEESEGLAAEIADVAVERVRAILNECSCADVGVLVRTNRALLDLVHRLRRAGIDASQEGGGPVSDSPAVAAVLSLLRLADHPDHRAAVYHVATSPLGQVLGLAVDGRDAGSVVAHVRRRLASEGYARTLAWIRQRVSSSLDEFDAARFDALIDLARRFEARAPAADLLRPTRFVEMVQAAPVERPAPAAVRVMTIHKAKGLEFDTVVLAEMHAPWKLRGGEVVALRPDPLAPVELATILPREELRWTHRRLEDAGDWALERRVHEELCGLYVAMTRPRRLLECVVPLQQTRKGELPLCSAGVVRAALGLPGGEPGRIIWQTPDPPQSWHAGIERPVASRPAAVRPRLRPGADDLPWRRRRATPATLADETISLRDILGPEPPAARRGTLLHAWFRCVHWLDEGEPVQADLERAAMELGATDWREHESAFRAALRGDLGARLRRDAYADRPADDLTVVREREFVVSASRPEPAILAGRFDRVVIGWSRGRPAWAQVIDFKSDRGDPDEIARRYLPQMEAYRDAARRLWGLEARAVDAVLFLVAQDRAVPI